MEKNYRLTERAEHDLLDIARYIAQDNTSASERFLDCAGNSFETLATMPNIGSVYSFKHTTIKNLRHWTIKKFENYIIFYQITTKPIQVEIIRVLHGARDLPALFEEDSL